VSDERKRRNFTVKENTMVTIFESLKKYPLTAALVMWGMGAALLAWCIHVSGLPPTPFDDLVVYLTKMYTMVIAPLGVLVVLHCKIWKG
jgi:hypothetical protein